MTTELIVRALFLLWHSYAIFMIVTRGLDWFTYLVKSAPKIATFSRTNWNVAGFLFIIEVAYLLWLAT